MAGYAETCAGDAPTAGGYLSLGFPPLGDLQEGSTVLYPVHPCGTSCLVLAHGDGPDRGA